MQGSLWVLACLLSVWAPDAGGRQQEAKHASEALDSMAPLYPSARRLASSFKDPAACLPLYVGLLKEAASSPVRCKPARNSLLKGSLCILSCFEGTGFT